MKDKKYLDDVNNKRVEETCTRVAHAIKLCAVRQSSWLPR